MRVGGVFEHVENENGSVLKVDTMGWLGITASSFALARADRYMRPRADVQLLRHPLERHRRLLPQPHRQYALRAIQQVLIKFIVHLPYLCAIRDRLLMDCHD